jgi:signal transduction histidine kinase
LVIIENQNTKKGNGFGFTEEFIKFQIQIQDNGVGISEENLEKLFINFGKLAEHDEMNKGGTGLGLSICKELIQQMGGKVSVKSKLGEGTTFFIDL